YLVAFSLFKNKRSVIVSNFQLFYTGIWFKYSLEHKKGRDNLYEAISCLKKIYSEITIILPPDIIDVRPFKWNNFKIFLRYTYIKETASYLNFRKDVKSNYKNSITLDLIFRSTRFNDFNWEMHHNHLLQIGCSNRKVQRYKQWLTNLDLQNRLLC